MTTLLFHHEGLLDEGVLRAAAVRQVEGSRLISAAATGDRKAISALHRGFWPFVKGFEEVIDKRGRELIQQRKSLAEKFGHEVTRDTLSSLARALRHMKAEEGSHAATWAADAQSLKIKDLSGPIAEGVQELLDSASNSQLWRHYSVLAGTEYTAEGLSARLSRRSPAFVSVFPIKKWLWGEVHLSPHDHGPSHRQIDEDLARALCGFGNDEERKSKLEGAILETITLFGKAADDVYDLYLKPRPRLRLAA